MDRSKEIEDDIWKVAKDIYRIEDKAFANGNRLFADELLKIRWELIDLVGGKEI